MNNESTTLIKTNSIFFKIKNFLKKLFKKNIKSENERTNYKTSKNDINFRDNIIIENSLEENRLLELQMKFENNQIVEEDISIEDIEKLSILYDKQIEKLRNKIEQNILNTEKYKKQIIAIKKEMVRNESSYTKSKKS